MQHGQDVIRLVLRARPAIMISLLHKALVLLWWHHGYQKARSGALSRDSKRGIRFFVREVNLHLVVRWLGTQKVGGLFLVSLKGLRSLF